MELKNTSTKIAALLAGATMLTANLNAQNPETAPDDTWLTVSGTVTSVAPQAFGLDYGDGILTVEMDDWDADADAYKVAVGDRVTVNGMVDDDLFDTTTIEASSVYVDNLNTYFYASAADEEDPFVNVTTPPVVSAIVVQGIVTDVDDAGVRAAGMLAGEAVTQEDSGLSKREWRELMAVLARDGS